MAKKPAQPRLKRGKTVSKSQNNKIGGKEVLGQDDFPMPKDTKSQDFIRLPMAFACYVIYIPDRNGPDSIQYIGQGVLRKRIREHLETRLRTFDQQCRLRAYWMGKKTDAQLIERALLQIYGNRTKAPPKFNKIQPDPTSNPEECDNQTEFSKTFLKEKRNPLPLRREPKTVAFVGARGGIGKTTLTYQIGMELAALGLRILFIDMDMQMALTRRFFADQKQVDGEANVIDAIKGSNRQLKLSERRCNDIPVWVLPGDRELDNEIARYYIDGLKGVHRLRLWIDTLSSKESFDYVLIDTPNGARLDTRMGMCAAAYWVIPFDGLEETIELTIHQFERDDLHDICAEHPPKIFAIPNKCIRDNPDVKRKRGGFLRRLKELIATKLAIKQSPSLPVFKANDDGFQVECFENGLGTSATPNVKNLPSDPTMRCLTSKSGKHHALIGEFLKKTGRYWPQSVSKKQADAARTT